MSVDTVLVTGAFGQVGTRCCEILLDRGKTVVATDLHGEATETAAHRLCEVERPGRLVTTYADLLDDTAVRALIAEHRPGAIVHLAGIYSPPSYRNPRFARKVNVHGTRNLVQAAASLPEPPLMVLASSASVYGSRNPHRHPERITAATPVNPVDQYGEDKVLAEGVVRGSGLPHAALRLGGVISPDGASSLGSDYLLLMRATPGDNRIHSIDARDAGLAFANAVDRGAVIDGKVLLIGGDETCVHLQRELEDDLMEAVGLGRLGSSASLPGDPRDDRGWSYTGWFDTTESQALLQYQEHPWSHTVAWVAAAQGHRRELLRAVGPILRPAIRGVLAVQRRREGRGRYADPWTLIENTYGPDVIAPTAF